MASANKPTPAMPSTSRRKSTKNSLIVKLSLSPEVMRKFGAPLIEEEPPLKDASSAALNALPVAVSTNGDNPSESASNTPVPSGTPVPSSMPPPTEVVKKKAVKRSSGVALGDGIPKVRGKPGPKKKARLEDGTIDHSNSAPRAAPGTAIHKLGPKANQGAINAGLRALDRSGKPCRKWQKGSFKIKSFTGVVWALPRWTAPPRITLESNSEGSASGGSSKENKDSSQIESEKSNSGADVEMNGSGSQKPASSTPIAPTTSPAPAPPTATALPAPPSTTVPPTITTTPA